MTGRRNDWIDGSVVGLAAVAVYARSIAFGFTGVDDRDLIVDDHAFLVHPSSLWGVFGRAYMHAVDSGHAYYRPLVTGTYVLDAQWNGTNPAGYHLTNVVLHLGACLLLWTLLRHFELGRGVTLAGALFFAVCPELVSAVAWIPGRNDSILCVCALAAWIALLRARPVAHLVFFALALLTKETAVVLPLVWSIHAALLEPRLRRLRTLGALAVGWTALVLARVLLHAPDAHPTLANLPLLVAGLGKIVLPFRPTAIASAADVPVWPGVVATVALAAASRLGAVRRRVLALGALTFVLLLVPPVLVPGSLVLDERLYLPAVSIVLMLAEIVRALAPEPGVLTAFVGATTIVLGAVSAAYEGSFRDQRTFARDAVAGSPRCGLAHFSLGQSYQIDGEDDRALAEYQATLALGPAEVVHNDIAVIYMKRAQWPQAESELREELALSPRYARAYYNLGIVLRREDRTAEACAAEEDALRLQPDDESVERERERDCGPSAR